MLVAASQEPAAASARQQGQPVRQESSPVRLATELVSLNVAVTDHSGRAITGLEKADFKVYENGVEQPLNFFSTDESPVSWGLVLDRSRSMEGMIKEVYRAALHAVEQGTADDDMFIVAFNDQADLLCDFTSDRDKLESAIRGLRAVGNTALYDAVALALDHLQRGRHKKKVLVVITDGEDNRSRLNFRQLVERAREADVLIYTVGLFGPMVGMQGIAARDELKKLAQVTGAFAHFPSDPEKCRMTMMAIASEVSRQYSLGYYPTDPTRDGKWRKLRIAVAQPGGEANYATRTRSGYYAPGRKLK
ncbi:MAG TPA: VWA domain-containing protein [Blastocatellia bacterium]|nr:VWA domain-containing protein [Blastocatellia bacterium]